MTYLIVVGVDGSDGGRRALRWAVQEAAGRGGTVQAVTAWRWDGLDGGAMVAPNPIEEEERAHALLAREIAAVTRDGTAAPVAAEVVEGRPADVLSAAARGADLLVLGSHGHGRLRHTVLGSVSEECVRKATCPVVVIPVPAPVPTNAAVPVLPG
ncbi:Nucleotide-binding universal stress protein, UspA family [Micromonospora phaseoli]|uniref:Nucleotide-binding universal stress protein, UspA family n=1 Tax=Micromonospora phaseoli TaxID=1144548 RepID=A0A1H6V188_9ACTN|nr:universal stress protein [Micromonospora phaseoli]PZV99104.1 nucleotide-binding universal stress UspA family protein [Micromonospora phaseoli]GIJ78695.1 universal stress protein [Micromonospora phaseoli]SEI94400.1 Nucleotide-binding universal stress protein, UspA family [Micromonospora phaseoli]